MTHVLRRGSVVVSTRAGDASLRGIVWEVADGMVHVLPVVRDRRRARPPRRSDVALGPDDALPVSLAAGDVIRAGGRRELAIAGVAVVGELSGVLLCRVVHAICRAHASVQAEQRWGDWRRHQDRAREERAVRPG